MRSFSSVVRVACCTVLFLLTLDVGVSPGGTEEYSEIHAILRQTRTVTNAIKDPYVRGAQLESLAPVWAEAASVQEAIKTVQAIPQVAKREYQPSPEKAQAFWQIIRIRAEAGDIQGALKLHDYLRDAHPHPRDFALAAIAVAMVKSGSTEGAFRLISSIQDPTHKAFSVSMLAAAQAQTGNISAALEAAATLPSDNIRADALAGIAAVQSKMGDTNGALHTVEMIRGTQQKTDALWDIALDQAASGKFKEALTVTSKMEESWDKTNALLDIAELQAETGDTLGALVVASSIPKHWERAIGLQGLARVQARIGDRKVAAETLQQAFQAAKLEPDSDLRGRAFIECAIAQAVLGDVKGSLRTANMLPNEEETHESPKRIRALEGIAVVQATAGDVNGALRTKNLILTNVKVAYPPESYKEPWAERAFEMSVLAKIVKARTQNGGHKEALKLAESIKDPEVKVAVLLSIAKGMLARKNPAPSKAKQHRFIFHM